MHRYVNNIMQYVWCAFYGLQRCFYHSSSKTLSLYDIDDVDSIPCRMMSLLPFVEVSWTDVLHRTAQCAKAVLSKTLHPRHKTRVNNESNSTSNSLIIYLYLFVNKQKWFWCWTWYERNEVNRWTIVRTSPLQSWRRQQLLFGFRHSTCPGCFRHEWEGFTCALSATCQFTWFP